MTLRFGKREALTLTTLGILAILGALFYRHQERTFFHQVEQELLAVARMKADQIGEWRHERLADGASFGANPYFQEAVPRWVRTPDSPPPEMLGSLEAFQRHYHYDDILLLDPRGQVLWASSESGSHPYLQGPTEGAFAEARPRLAGPFFPTETPPHLDLLVPFFHPDGTPAGALALSQKLPSGLLLFLREWPLPSRSGEILLLEREPSRVRVLDPAHKTPEWISLDQSQRLVVRAALGDHSLLEGVDYRDVPILAAARPVPGSPWLVQVRMGQKEALEAWDREARPLFLLFAGMLSLLALLGVAQWRQDLRLRERLLEEVREDLARSEARYRNFFQNHHAMMWVVDPQTGHILEANPAAAAFYGYSQDELAGMPVGNINTSSPDRIREALDAAASGARRSFQTRHRLADGQVRDMEVFSGPVPWEGREALYSILHDVTDSLAAAAERDRLASAVEQAGDSILITDPQGVLLYVNPAFCALSGYSREEALERNIQDLGSNQDRDLHRQILEALGRGEPWRGTFPCTRKEGTPYVLEGTVSPVRDASGALTHVVEVARDVTDAHRVQEERATLQRRLAQAQKMESVGRLAGGVAHDFNNQLQVILGTCELSMRNLTQEDPLREDLEEIRKAAEHSAELTGQLLAFARRQAAAPRVLDLNETVQTLLPLLRRMAGEAVTLDWTPGTDLWPVKMDPYQVEQILANLTTNAREAIEGTGRIRVETRNVTLDEPPPEAPEGGGRDYVRLLVQDDGHGMDEATREHAFEPFFSTKEDLGTGLGLPTVEGIVLQNGGFLQLQSERGMGSTFRIFLPRFGGPVEPEAPRGASDFPRGQGEILLLVEDEPQILALERRTLQDLGYEVLASGDPKEALALAAESPRPIDLLVTDVVLPGMNGRELAEHLWALDPSMKCLFLSGYTADVIARHGVLDEGVQFLPKPFTMKDLARRIREILRE